LPIVASSTWHHRPVRLEGPASRRRRAFSICFSDVIQPPVTSCGRSRKRSHAVIHSASAKRRGAYPHSCWLHQNTSVRLRRPLLPVGHQRPV
jgi:hypothetical protein